MFHAKTKTKAAVSRNGRSRRAFPEPSRAEPRFAKPWENPRQAGPALFFSFTSRESPECTGGTRGRDVSQKLGRRRARRGQRLRGEGWSEGNLDVSPGYVLPPMRRCPPRADRHEDTTTLPPSYRRQRPLCCRTPRPLSTNAYRIGKRSRLSGYAHEPRC